MPSGIKKILIIRFSSIGDIVLTSPVIRCLKKQLQAEIHFLTKKVYAPIVQSNPYISSVFSIEKQVAEVLKKLKAEQYDYVIDLHKNLRSLQVKLSLRTKSASFDKLNYEKWLLCNFKINKLPEIHIVDRYLKSVERLNVKNDRQGLEYFIPEKEKINLNHYSLQAEKFIAFAIGAAHQTKRLTDEKMIAICQAIKYPIVLLGGPGDASRGAKIAQAAGTHVLNQCGQLNVHQSASLIEQSLMVLTHDTGMMHIAAAFRKTIISVWGNTIPAFGMFPYYPEGMNKNTSFEVPDLKCRPCSKIGHATCPKSHFNCMQKQDTRAIITKVKHLISL